MPNGTGGANCWECLFRMGERADLKWKCSLTGKKISNDGEHACGQLIFVDFSELHELKDESRIEDDKYNNDEFIVGPDEGDAKYPSDRLCHIDSQGGITKVFDYKIPHIKRWRGSAVIFDSEHRFLLLKSKKRFDFIQAGIPGILREQIERRSRSWIGVPWYIRVKLLESLTIKRIWETTGLPYVVSKGYIGTKIVPPLPPHSKWNWDQEKRNGYKGHDGVFIMVYFLFEAIHSEIQFDAVRENIPQWYYPNASLIDMEEGRLEVLQWAYRLIKQNKL